LTHTVYARIRGWSCLRLEGNLVLFISRCLLDCTVDVVIGLNIVFQLRWRQTTNRCTQTWRNYLSFSIQQLHFDWHEQISRIFMA